MKKKITLKQIARELDVSISTVSKALRNSIEISEDTRQKVQAFAKFYNYRPNNIALSLKNRKTKTIGIIIPEIVHHFFSKEVINMEMLANGSIDGFILSIAKETLQQQDYHHFTETISQGMPIVMFDRVVNEIKCDKVIVDDTEGAKLAVNKLIACGCKNIAIVTTKDYVSVGKLRTQGYLEALEDHKIDPKASLLLKVHDQLLSEDHLDSLEIEIENLFKNNKKIDGVFAVNELYAITTMKVARKLGLTIPDDLQIVGFTDGVLSKHAVPALTTVSQHGKKIGEKAAELLINNLEREDEEDIYETVVIETELIERASTK